MSERLNNSAFWASLEYILRVAWPWTPKEIPEPSHGRVFCEKFRTIMC